jgi:hypothetical protein
MAFETISLFDDLENDQTMQRVASRRTLALAHTRVEQHLGAFFRGAQSVEEFEARLALVVDDFNHYVASSAEEIGYSTPEHVRETILESYRTASAESPTCDVCNKSMNPVDKMVGGTCLACAKKNQESVTSSVGEPCPNCGKPGGCDHGHDEESEEDDETAPKTSAFKWSVDNFAAPGQPGGAASMPPNGNMVGAPGVTPPVQNAATAMNPQAGGAAAVPTVPQGTTNPNADINDVGQQSQGGIPLGANATMPGMNQQTPTVTGSVVAAEGYSPADQDLDGDGASVLDALDHSGPDEDKTDKKTSHVWKITGYPGYLAAANTDCELCSERVPKSSTSVVDGLRLCPDCRGNDTPDASQTSELETQNRQASSGNTDLGGPEPKIDKAHKPVGDPEDGTEDSGRWPTKRKDIVEPIKAENRDVNGKPNHVLKEIGEKTTETEKLPGNKGDAGFDNGGVNKGPHTKTFDGKGQVDPVTKPVFPDKSAVESAFRSLV